MICTNRSMLTAGEDGPSMAKLRTWLRLLAGTISLSVGGDPKILFKILKGLTDLNYQRDKDRAQIYLTVLAAFAKAGREEFLGQPVQLPSQVSASSEVHWQLTHTAIAADSAPPLSLLKAEFLSPLELFLLYSE